MAAVFSKCEQPPGNEPDPTTPGNCCLDPVVYQRVDEEIKHWIRNTAPGVRDSMGCPKKIIRMILKHHKIVSRVHPPVKKSVNFFSLATKRKEPPTGTCRCGVEKSDGDNDNNRILGGEKIEKVVFI